MIATLLLPAAYVGTSYYMGKKCPMDGAPKSKTAPPGYVFGIVWTILYALLGYVMARLWYMYGKSSGNNRHVILAAIVFGVLAFGTSIYWVYIFGCKRKQREALYVLLAFVFFVMMHLYLVAKLNLVLGALTVPLMVWSIFALLMNHQIVNDTTTLPAR